MLLMKSMRQVYLKFSLGRSRAISGLILFAVIFYISYEAIVSCNLASKYNSNIVQSVCYELSWVVDLIKFICLGFGVVIAQILLPNSKSRFMMPYNAQPTQ